MLLVRMDNRCMSLYLFSLPLDACPAVAAKAFVQNLDLLSSPLCSPDATQAIDTVSNEDTKLQTQ